MNQFIKNPNLPTKKVNIVMVSCEDKSLIKALNDIDINVIAVMRNGNLEPYVASHADTLTYYNGNGNIFIDKEQLELIKQLKNYHFNVSIINNIKSPYPNDCILNCCDIGNYIICNRNIVEKEIIKSALSLNKEIIHVNQGYSKCSICVVKKNTIITDDKSIYNAISKHSDIDALLIEKGDIKLNGCNYGFIGGCSGLIDYNHLFFNGDIHLHKDFNKIDKFLNERNVIYSVIKNKQLTDIGSIIPLMEEKGK